MFFSSLVSNKTAQGNFCMESKKDPSTPLHYAQDDNGEAVSHFICHSECNEESNLLGVVLHFVRQECFGAAVESYFYIKRGSFVVCGRRFALWPAPKCQNAPLKRGGGAVESIMLL